MTNAVWHRLLLMLGRGIIRAVNSQAALQTIDVSLMADEDKDGLEHFETYGYTANPPTGLELLAAFLGGDRSHGVVIAIGDRKFRLKGLQPGEVALYTDEGDFIHFQRGRKIAVSAGSEIAATAPVVRLIASDKVRCETPKLECTGEIMDLCDSDGRTMSHMRSIFDSHVHPENDNGGPTDPPSETM